MNYQMNMFFLMIFSSEKSFFPTKIDLCTAKEIICIYLTYASESVGFPYVGTVIPSSNGWADFDTH